MRRRRVLPARYWPSSKESGRDRRSPSRGSRRRPPSSSPIAPAVGHHARDSRVVLRRRSSIAAATRSHSFADRPGPLALLTLHEHRSGNVPERRSRSSRPRMAPSRISRTCRAGIAAARTTSPSATPLGERDAAFGRWRGITSAPSRGLASPAMAIGSFSATQASTRTAVFLASPGSRAKRSTTSELDAAVRASVRLAIPKSDT